MKLKNILYYIAIIVFFTSQLWAQNTNPVVTNVTFSITGTTVTVHYDVTDAEQSTVTISMEVSSDGGTTWNDQTIPTNPPPPDPVFYGVSFIDANHG